jgi:hypothetical protein
VLGDGLEQAVQVIEVGDIALDRDRRVAEDVDGSVELGLSAAVGAEIRVTVLGQRLRGSPTSTSPPTTRPA